MSETLVGVEWASFREGTTSGQVVEFQATPALPSLGCPFPKRIYHDVSFPVVGCRIAVVSLVVVAVVGGVLVVGVLLVGVGRALVLV